MSIFSKRMNPYLQMNEEEFVQESLSVFDKRVSMERAIALLKLQKKPVPASDYRPKFNSQKASYSMNETIDISHFSDCKTLEIDITPVARFGDREFRFINRILVDGKELKDRQIDDRLETIYLDLRQYISRMDDQFKANQQTRGWSGHRR